MSTHTTSRTQTVLLAPRRRRPRPRPLTHGLTLAWLIVTSLLLGACSKPDPRLENVLFRSDVSTLEVDGSDELTDWTRRGYETGERIHQFRFFANGECKMFRSAKKGSAPAITGKWKKAEGDEDRLEIDISEGDYKSGHAVFDGDDLIVTLGMPVMKMDGSTEFISKDVTMTYEPQGD